MWVVKENEKPRMTGTPKGQWYHLQSRWSFVRRSLVAPWETEKSALNPPSLLVEVLKSLDTFKISWGLSSHDLLSLYAFFCNAVGFYTIFIHMWNCSVHLLLQVTQRNIPEHCRFNPRACGQMVVTMGTRKESFPDYFLYSFVLKTSLGLCPSCIWPPRNPWLSSLLILSHSLVFSSSSLFLWSHKPPPKPPHSQAERLLLTLWTFAVHWQPGSWDFETEGESGKHHLLLCLLKFSCGR